VADATPNIELLEETYRFIEANPQHWNQRSWRCKTGMCFAGWAAELAGGEWLLDARKAFTYDSDTVDMAGDYLVPAEGDVKRYKRTLVVEGETLEGTHVEDRAARVLGLNYEESEALFDGSNDLEDLRRVIDDVKARVT
jgi:hypothetical protein